MGNLLSLTDPENNETVWQYDPLDRVNSERNMLGYARAFEYDAVGNLQRRTDRNGRVIEYLYDRLDRPTDEYWYEDTAAADLGPGNELRLILPRPCGDRTIRPNRPYSSRLALKR